MMMMKRRDQQIKDESSSKKKNIFLLILKKVKISHLIFLAVLLAANSYAWFIYVNNVSNRLDVHVRAWKVDFEDDGQVVEEVNVEVNNAYPGMANFTKTVTAHNYSDLPATASYKVLYANIMGTEYYSQEGKADAGLTYTASDPTAAELEEMLTEDYPFTFGFNLSQTTLVALTGTADYTVSLVWPYESGDDEADTYWGVEAFNYKEDNPTEPSIKLKIKIYVTQDNS